MVSPTNSWRYEKKFLPTGFCTARAMRQVLLHPAGFREVYPPRDVNNLYLDTPHLADYRDHVNGVAERGKTRIRWYGRLKGPVAESRLERKMKRGMVGRKEIYPLMPWILNDGVDAREAQDTLRTVIGAPAGVRCRLEVLVPSLINRYRRRYFESGDGRIRLTVDSELTYYDPRMMAAGNGASVPEDLQAVMELKYSPQYAGDAARVANQFPFRAARCSKYVEGLYQLHRGVGVSGAFKR